MPTRENLIKNATNVIRKYVLKKKLLSNIRFGRTYVAFVNITRLNRGRLHMYEFDAILIAAYVFVLRSSRDRVAVHVRN